MRRARPATEADELGLLMHIDRAFYLHQHPDWRQPEEWLGARPFWVSEEQGRLVGAIAFPPDPPGIYWLRLFSVGGDQNLEQIWDELFSGALKDLGDHKDVQIPVLCGQTWLSDLLSRKGFAPYDAILQLVWKGSLPAEPGPGAGSLRPMEKADLENVAGVDARAFLPLWGYSLEELRRALEGNNFARVVEVDGEPVAYALGSISPAHAHLERLAVAAEWQERGIGSRLLYAFLKRAQQRGTRYVTVNTQESNRSSLKLYEWGQFAVTEERYPVLMYSAH
jgi:ribosomal protein S18 acetylase RimI-like enzyme